LFSGDADGNLLALDSRSGKLLWHYQMGCDAAWHIADDVHDRWATASAGAVGHDAHCVGN
jgi:outer membrane protein assembly factor BamB